MTRYRSISGGELGEDALRFIHVGKRLIGVGMRDSYKVVSATSDHVALLPEIERSAASLFSEHVPPELLEITTPEPVLLAAQRDGTLWVAVGPDDEAVGFARVTIEADRAHLAELDVLPAHGRRGIGTALVRAIEVWARSGDYPEITLTTYRDLPWNAPFYAHLGFAVVPECDWDADLRRRFEEEAGLDSERARRVVMRMTLGAAQAGR